MFFGNHILQFPSSVLSMLKQYLDHQLEGMSSTCQSHKVTPSSLPLTQPAANYLRVTVNTTKANACDCAVCTQFPVLCSETGRTMYKRSTCTCRVTRERRIVPQPRVIDYCWPVDDRNFNLRTACCQINLSVNGEEERHWRFLLKFLS